MQWITKPNKHLWVAIVPLLHTNSGTIGVGKRRFLYIMGAKTLQNTIKTASEISKSDFYFVTDFYRLYDICMGLEENEGVHNMFLCTPS